MQRLPNMKFTNLFKQAACLFKLIKTIQKNNQKEEQKSKTTENN